MIFQYNNCTFYVTTDYYIATTVYPIGSGEFNAAITFINFPKVKTKHTDNEMGNWAFVIASTFNNV